MASLLFSLMAPIVLIFPTCQSQSSPPVSWKLALHWPNSFCRVNGIKCSPSIPQNAFVIRTLFGVNKNGQEMTCSGTQPPLNPSSIARLQQMLTLYWPDLQGDDFGLWQKEWQQRAACFGIDPAFYFVNAIDLKMDIDQQIVNNGFGGLGFNGEQVFGALSRQGVRPGNTYPATTLEDKISSTYGEALEVLCDKDSAGINQLLEYHMCATASSTKFSLIPCPVQKTINCNTNVRFT